jgi:hypothetical protein
MQKYNSELKQIKTKGKKEEDEDKDREISSSSLLGSSITYNTNKQI